MRSGANAISYGIYRDAAMTQAWGSGGGGVGNIGAGSGTLTAYGQVPAQTSPPPGSYSDVVNVTINY